MTRLIRRPTAMMTMQPRLYKLRRAESGFPREDRRRAWDLAHEPMKLIPDIVPRYRRACLPSERDSTGDGALPREWPGSVRPGRCWDRRCRSLWRVRQPMYFRVRRWKRACPPIERCSPRQRPATESEEKGAESAIGSEATSRNRDRPGTCLSATLCPCLSINQARIAARRRVALTSRLASTGDVSNARRYLSPVGG